MKQNVNIWNLKSTRMKSLLKALFVLGVFAFFAPQAKASHVAGVDISYECIGKDSFKITVNVFRDCSGISATPNVNGLTITSPCGAVTPNFVLTNPNSPLPNANNGTQVSQLCGSALPNSACSGGPFPGMMQLIFEAIVVLPPCNFWTIGYSPPCCRNTNVNLSTASSGAYVQSTLNNLNDSCNTGPAFAAQPIPYVCAGQVVHYNFGAFEPDGDSLVYSFISGFSAPNVPNVFNFPYTPTQPLIGATINSKTGEVIFTPTATGNFVVVVEVREYDSNGNLLSTIMRDILFVVQICSNQQPNPVAPISGFTGTGALIDSNSVEVCVGETFTFNVKIWDPNPNDSISLKSNVATMLPGATFTVSYPPNKTDTVIATISWTAVPVSGNFYPFFIEANDNACPIPGIFYATFDVRIINSTIAFPNQTICQFSQQATIEASGGTQFTWVALPGGDPIVVGPPKVGNFACDTCKITQAYPLFTTCYEVTSNLSGSCRNVDTVCVRVAPDYTLTTSNDTLICSVAPISLFTSSSDPAQNYKYNWKPTIGMTGIKSPTPTVNPESTTTYTVTVESDSGCIKTDDVTVTLSPPFPKENLLSASDTIICLQDTVNLGVVLGDVTPAKCGPATNQCVGSTATIQVGNGTATNSFQSSFNGIQGFPAPFAGDDGSAKHQFLYRASDLLAAGVQGGQITAIAFNIVSNNGPLVYNNYTVKMGCTTGNSLNTNWVGGLTQVYNPKPTFPNPGWTTLNFDTPFDWDGKSNIVIETCFDNGGSASQNAISQHTVTSYPSCSFVAAAANVCGAFTQNAQSPINKLPNVRFTVCSGVDPNAFSFNWYNAVNLVAPTTSTDQNIDMSVNLTTPKNYSVAIADTYNVCFDTLDFRIHVVSSYDATPDSAGPFCDISPYYFMQAFTPYNITTPGGKWSGPGIIDDTLGLFDPGPAGAGLGVHWIKYAITGDACAAEDSIQVSVLPPPDPTVITQGPFCELDTAVLIVGVNPGYISSNNPNIAKGIVDSSGVLDLSLVPNNFDTLTLTWTAFGGACNNDTTIRLPLTPQFDARIAVPESYCPHDSVVRLFQVDSILGGNWTGTGIVNSRLGLFDPSAYAPGSVANITLDSVGLCGNTGTIQIKIDTLPQISFFFTQGDDGPYCKGDGSVVVFGANPLNDPDDLGVGSWNHINSWLGTTNPTTGFSTNNPLPRAGTHTSVYKFTDLNGCINEDTIQFVIGVNPPNPIGSTDYFCQGEFLNGLLVQDSVQDPFDTNNTYVWYSDAALSDSLHTGYYFNSQEVGVNDISYYVQQISPEGCKSQGYGIVKALIAETPNVEFTASSIRGVEPLVVDFINLTNNNSVEPVNYWEWYVFGLGGDRSLVSNDENTSFEFPYAESFNPAPGDSGYAVYTAYLYGRNEFGCSDTFSLRIIVDATSELIIPNIFTPNGDGMNDEFAPTVSGMRAYEGVIFNRWGRKVAELDFTNPTWNGVDPQSDDVTDGVYYYVITAEGNNGQEYNEKGTVTLIK